MNEVLVPVGIAVTVAVVRPLRRRALAVAKAAGRTGVSLGAVVVVGARDTVAGLVHG